MGIAWEEKGREGGQFGKGREGKVGSMGREGKKWWTVWVGKGREGG